MTYTIITHGDSDGIISAAISIIEKGATPEYFFTSSPGGLHRTLAYTVMKNTPSPLYILDLSPTERYIYLAAYHDNVIWIDHHNSEEDLPNINHVEVVIQREAKSAARVVARHLGLCDRADINSIVEVADQIDTNNVSTEEGEMLRACVGYIKSRFSRDERDKKMLQLAENIAKLGTKVVYLDEYQRYAETFINEVTEALESIKKEVKTREINGFKVAFISTERNVPVFAICNMLKEEQGEYDIIIVKYTKHYTHGTTSKFEFRTHTGKNVYAIAKLLGGGGHPLASGATMEGNMTEDSIYSLLKVIDRKVLETV